MSSIRQDMVKKAVSFLRHPKVKNAPLEKQVSFLRDKSLTTEVNRLQVNNTFSPSRSDVMFHLQHSFQLRMLPGNPFKHGVQTNACVYWKKQA